MHSKMITPLRILFLENNSADAAIIRSTFKAGGIACKITRVQSRDAFGALISRGCFDLALSDYSLLAFDGLSTISHIHDHWPDLPIILVSGIMGEDLAVESLKKGATDYILKKRLFRLVPAVRRAIEEVAERTKRRRMKGQLIEARKMEVTGHHAAGVAHDFNNILHIIMGFSGMLLTKLPIADPLRNYAEEILRASKHGAALTQQLLVLSRKHKVQPVVTDLNAVLRDQEKMLERLLHENITFALSLGTRIGNILADPGYIGQMLMNMATNARDAMPDGGSFTIATSKVTLDEYSTHIYPGSLPGNYILLSVSDTGTGMSEEVKARIFEAFFTTKPLGKGTGLGLANCRTIIQQSGACMSVTSELGKGTNFQILFPCFEEVC